MRKRRILPARWPRTSWPLSSFTRNIRLGRASVISPSNSTFSSTAMHFLLVAVPTRVASTTLDDHCCRRLALARFAAQACLPALRTGRLRRRRGLSDRLRAGQLAVERLRPGRLRADAAEHRRGDDRHELRAPAAVDPAAPAARA